MQINIQPVSNGWLVEAGGKRNVFIDRKDMLKHIDDVVPPTSTEDAFIDALGDDEECDEWDEEDKCADPKIQELLEKIMSMENPF